ncbi:MAG: efflux RND transporter periplasmic adaptor subunit [Candidatus Binataceae bacterium]
MTRRLWQRLPRLAAAMVIVSLVSCNREASDRADDSAAPMASVVLAVSGVRAELAPIRAELSLQGTTVAQRHLTLRAPAAGRVLDFNLKSGDRVRRGAVVAHVINREIEAAQNGLAVARTIDPGEAPALAAALKRNLAPAAIAVTAPDDAVVAQPLVSSGQMVADLDPLADLIDPRGVYVEAAVPFGDVESVRPGMTASVVSPLQPQVQLPARVAAFSPSFGAGSATAPVRIEFAGPDRIAQVGAPVAVIVTTAYVPNAIVIPEAALFSDASTQSRYLFVAGADGRAHRRVVKIGLRAADRAQIVDGLAAGEVVITSGGYALSDGLRVKVAIAQS